MNLHNIFPKIMGFVIIVLTLAMSPTIAASNAAILLLDLTDMLAMDVMAEFGGPLIVFGLLFSGGLFAYAGVRGNIKEASIQDVGVVIGNVILVIVALSFMTSIIGYVQDLIDVSTGFAIVIYGIIPMAIYLGIVASTSVITYKKYKKLTGKEKSGKKPAAAGAINY